MYFTQYKPLNSWDTTSLHKTQALVIKLSSPTPPPPTDGRILMFCGHVSSYISVWPCIAI